MPASQLLAREKDATRARDALNADRRRLPMVETFTFDPAWNDGCSSCSGRFDQYGNLDHLHARDTTMAVVSRVPLARIEPFKARKCWTFPWYSSYGRDLNYDFHVTLDEAVTPVGRARGAPKAGEQWP